MNRFLVSSFSSQTCLGCLSKSLKSPIFLLKTRLSCLRTPQNGIFRNFYRLQHTNSGGKANGGTTPKLADLSKKPKNEIGRLFKLTKPVKLRLTGGIVLLVISSTISISVPYFMGKIIDTMLLEEPSLSSGSKSGTSNSTKNSVFPTRGGLAPISPIDVMRARSDESGAVIFDQTKADRIMSQLGKLCGILICVFLVGAIANFGRSFLMQTAAQRVVNRLRKSVFSSILKQEIGFFDKSKTGELVNRLSNDATLVGTSITMNISDGLRSLASAAGGSGMMIYVSPKLALVGFCIIPPVAAASIIYGRYAKNLTKQSNDALAAATQVAEERILNIRAVRAFGAEEKENGMYSRRIDVVLNWAKQDAFARSVFFGFAGLSGNLIMLAILYAGGSFVTGGSMTIGQLSSFLLYALYVGVSIGGLSQFYSELMRGVGASTRLFQLVDKKETIPLTGGIKPESLRGEVVFENVNFAYPMRPESAIFRNFSLVIPDGNVTAVVGYSGSGKSTLPALLLRFYDPDQGKVLLDGRDIRTLDPTWLRKNVGTVTQDPTLFSCTVAENIAYGAEKLEEVRLEDVKEAARQANALEFIDNFPHGFNTLVGERGLTLSGGQRQRIAIARALLNNPKLLIFDEATSALDAESEHQVRTALRRLLREGRRTVMIIAHRLSTIKNADQIAVISSGELKELGTYKDLISVEDGLFKQLVEKQTVGTEDAYV